MGEQKFAKTFLVTWSRWPPCPYMVKNLKNLLLWNQTADNPASGAWVLPSLLKWWPWVDLDLFYGKVKFGPLCFIWGERGGSVVECRTPEREVRGSRPTAAVLCPWARHFTPRKYWLITQEAMAPSRHDWKIVDWDVKPQHNQPTNYALYDRFSAT